MDGGLRAPLYADRDEAGAKLADALRGHAGPSTLVLGIPRGGVPVAAAVARALGAELDIVVARKLGAPGQPELAIGAVTADGGTFLNDEILALLGVPQSYLDLELAHQRVEAQRREHSLRGTRPAARIAGRTVILIDDGLATGATMHAAARCIRAHEPARLIAAVPVGARDSCLALARDVDELICLAQPEPFHAVGLAYLEFDQVDDAEVRRLLNRYTRSQR